MIKVVTPDSWGFDDATTALVKVAARGLRGVDRAAFVKRAGHDFLPHLGEVRPGEVPAHIIVVGSTDHYGCFAAGTPFALADGNYSPIETVEVGDTALTAEGHAQPVTATFRRTVHSGLTFDVAGLPDLLQCSNDHPFRVARFEQFACRHDRSQRCLPPLQGQQNICKRPKRAARACVLSAFPAIDTQWATAETLRVGDFLVWTCPAGLPDPLGLDEHEGYLLGAWLAEGSFQRNSGGNAISSLVLRTHIDELAFWDRIVTACDACGFSYSIHDNWEESTRRYNVTGNPPRFREYSAQFGSGARFKRLPAWVCCLPRRVRLAVLAGYLDGDGSCVVSEKENRTTARTHSRALASGMQRLAWSLGFPAVVCNVKPRDEYAAGGAQLSFSGQNPGFNVSVANSYLGDLAEFSWKVRGRDLEQTTKVHGFWHAGRMYLPIRGIAAINTPFDVFNVEIEGDHTYSGPNVDSHNCNRNGDAFDADDCRRCHDSFRKVGHWFRNHANKPTDLRYGRIIKTAFHEPMQRIELLVGFYEDEAAARAGGGELGRIGDREIEKLASGDTLPCSMACRIRHDVCTFCKNAARSRDEYCHDRPVKFAGRTIPACSGFGCRDGLTKVAADGRMQYVHNPDPVFFDSSTVYRNADRIAFGLGLLKAAAEGRVAGGAELAARFPVTAPLALDADDPLLPAAARDRLKVADLLAACGRDDGLSAYDGGLRRDPVGPLPAAPPSAVLRALADAGGVLAPADWLALAAGKEAAAHAADLAPHLPGALARFAADDAAASRLASAASAPGRELPPAWLRDWAAKAAAVNPLAPSAVAAKARRQALRGVPAPAPAARAKAAAADSPGAARLAEAYAHYVIAAVAGNPAVAADPLARALTARAFDLA